MLRIGLISDTHGLLRPEASAFLEGCDHILHGGDVGSREILLQLSRMAPLTAVRGNNDNGAWAERLPLTARVQFEQVWAYLIHDIADLDLDPRAEGVGVVISGHSHRPLIREHDGILYVNPGSAGPRRFRLPIAVAALTISGSAIAPRIVELAVGAGSAR